MDPELIKILASTGLGGILALVVINWKRGDDQKHAADLRAINDRLEARDNKMLEYIAANTTTLRGLQSSIEAVASIRHIEERLVRLEK